MIEEDEKDIDSARGLLMARSWRHLPSAGVTLNWTPEEIRASAPWMCELLDEALLQMEARRIERQGTDTPMPREGEFIGE